VPPRAGSGDDACDGPPSPAFAARLIDWQLAHGRRHLPWQDTNDPYRIWLSEIMLQQTQVATAIPYYLRFVAAFPDVATLAAAPLDRVLEHWSGLGYYRRAHHLHAAARQVVADHRGVFPPSVAALTSLPGVGRSTAAAIAAFAFGTRAAILDGNVKRVLARHRGVAGSPGAARVVAGLWQLAEALLPDIGIATYTQALMDLGATVCTRTRPACADCPVHADCVALRTGQVDALPSPRPLRTLPQRSLVVLLVEHAGALLLEQRPATGVWGGLWSLPELALDADIALHCRRAFGVEVAITGTLPAIEHRFTHYRLQLHPRHVVVCGGPACTDLSARIWRSPADADRAALPAPIRKLVRRFGRDRASAA
jgi:A/G-specific adenine glycosylase